MLQIIIFLIAGVDAIVIEKYLLIVKITISI